MSKKVCMFVWNHFTNDARVLREATALVEDGYEVYVICLYAEKLSKSQVIEGVRVERIQGFKPYSKNGLRKSKLLWLFNTIITMIAMTIKGIKISADIYHSHDLNTLIQGYFCSKFFKNRKLIYDSHEVQTSRTGIQNKNIYYLEKFLIKRVDEVITTTNTRADYIANLYGIVKPKVIHNYPVFLDIDKIEKVDLYKIANIPKEEPILLYQGGLQEGRGLELAIKAMPMIKKGILVFIGNGNIENRLKKMVLDMDLSSRVRFIDTVPLKELPKYTVNGFIGLQLLQNICFNHYSAASNKLFEYILCEAPVIASDMPEIRKVIKESRVGLLIEEGIKYEYSLAETINNVLFDKDKYDEFKQNCKAFKKNYSWNCEKKHLLSIYKEQREDINGV